MPLRFIGGPGRSEITNILTRDSLWDDIFYLNNFFQHEDGYDTNVSGSASINMNAGTLELSTGATINSEIHSRLNVDPSTIFSFDKIRRFRTLIGFPDDTNQQCYVLTGRKADALADGGLYPYFGFKITNNQIFGCVGNAVGETLTAQLATFGAATHVLFEARFIPGVEVRFYLNGVYIGILTTGLPTGTAEAFNLMYLWLKNTAAAGRAIGAHYWEFYQAR